MKQLKNILNMEYYLQYECYCPGEIYSVDGFFFKIFRAETEYKEIGRCDEFENHLSKVPFIAVISKSKDDDVQILFIMHKENKIVDILRFDATDNNIQLIKEVIEKGSTELQFNEYEEGKTEKSLNKMFELADAICID